MKKSIAVVMAHADDIELSAGATLAKYIHEGYRALYGVLSRCNSGWTVTEEKGGALHLLPGDYPATTGGGGGRRKGFRG